MVLFRWAEGEDRASEASSWQANFPKGNPENKDLRQPRSAGKLGGGIELVDGVEQNHDAFLAGTLF